MTVDEENAVEIIPGRNKKGLNSALSGFDQDDISMIDLDESAVDSVKGSLYYSR